MCAFRLGWAAKDAGGALFVREGNLDQGGGDKISCSRWNYNHSLLERAQVTLTDGDALAVESFQERDEDTAGGAKRLP